MSDPDSELNSNDAMATFWGDPGGPFFQVFLKDGEISAQQVHSSLPNTLDVTPFDAEAETLAFQLSGVKTEELAIFELFAKSRTVEWFSQMADSLRLVTRFRVVWKIVELGRHEA